MTKLLSIAINLALLSVYVCGSAWAGQVQKPPPGGPVMPEVDSSILALIGTGAAVGIAALRRSLRKSK